MACSSQVHNGNLFGMLMDRLEGQQEEKEDEEEDEEEEKVVVEVVVWMVAMVSRDRSPKKHTKSEEIS